MNILLWVLQALLAFIFMYSGINKSIFSEQKLVASGQTGVEGLPIPLIRFIGITEILGSIGLVLPYLLGFLPVLTPIAALCFALIMAFAGVIHFKRQEYKNVILNTVLFVVCLFIAYNRF